MPVFGCLLVLFFMMQFGLAGRWITFPKGREHAQGVCSKFGQPKAKCNLTVLAMKCIRRVSFIGLAALNCNKRDELPFTKYLEVLLITLTAFLM